MEVVHAVLSSHVVSQIVEYLTVVLQQLQGEVSGGVVLGDVLVGLQVFLDVADAVLNLMPVVDVEVARELAGALVDLNDSSEELLDTFAILERGGNHRHTEEVAQGGDVYMVATTLKLIIHVEGADHADVHIHQLGGQIEVALKVGGIDDIDDHIGHRLRQVLPHIELLGRVAGEGVGARQVGEVELIAEELCMGLGGIDGDTRVVAHMAMGSRGKVEERGLATVGITHQGHIDHTALLHGLVLDIVVLVDAGIFGQREMGGLDGGVGRYHFDIVGLLMTE